MTEEFWARAEKQGGIEVAITDKGIKVRVPDSKNPAPPAPYTLEDFKHFLEFLAKEKK